MLMLGPAEVDLDARRVCTPSGEVSLSGLEATLLAFLRDNRGATISRQRLLQEVWGYAPQVESRAVDHAVSRLRRKIESDPTRPVWIRSVRGAGYRLELPDSTPDDMGFPVPNAPFGAFYGRQQELAAIEDGWADGHRLLTLLGPPGIGKTRLCREVAQGAGIAWLQGARDASDVLGAVARSMVLDLHDTRDVAGSISRIGSVLAHRGPTLLCLDNVEHLVEDVASMVPQWLDAAPLLRILATSRVRLGVQREHVVKPSQLGAADGAALMVDRARRARGHYDPSDDDRVILEQLAVEQLDGLPLALELAGARLGIMDAQGLASRMTERFALLKGERTDASWSGLESAILWSWEMLTDDERGALAQCTVFSDGFDLSAAESVVETAQGWVPDLIGGLVDHSLLQRLEGEPPRFDLLLSVRDFAQRHGDVAEAESRHRRWCAGDVASRFPLLDAPGADEVLTGLVRELANLRTAHRSAIRNRDVVSAVPIAQCLYAVSVRRGPDHEGLEATEATLPLVEEGRPDWFELSWRYGDALRGAQDLSRAKEVLLRAGALASRDEDRAMVFTSILPLATELGDEAWFDASAALAAESAVKAGDVRRSMIVSNARAVWACFHGELESAEAHAARAQSLESTVGDPFLATVCAVARGSIARMRGNLHEALVSIRHALDVAERHAFPKYVQHATLVLGLAHLDRGEPSRALEQFSTAVDLALRQGDEAKANAARVFSIQAQIDQRDFGHATTALADIGDWLKQAHWARGLGPLMQAQLAVGSHDLRTAGEWLAEAYREVEDGQPLPMVRARVKATYACFLLGQGRTEESASLLSELESDNASRRSMVVEQMIGVIRGGLETQTSAAPSERVAFDGARRVHQEVARLDGWLRAS